MPYDPDKWVLSLNQWHLHHIATQTSGSLDHSRIDLPQRDQLPFAARCPMLRSGERPGGCRVANVHRRLPNYRPPSEFLRHGAPPRSADATFETDEGEWQDDRQVRVVSNPGSRAAYRLSMSASPRKRT